MTKQIWINLPVKDLVKSKEFFTSLGFNFNTPYGNGPVSACMMIGDKGVVVMLFIEPVFKTFTQTETSDTAKGTEVLFSIDAESKAEVDELATKVKAAGGTLYSNPTEVQGWMYGFGFIDLDGHRWNSVFMDMSKMPK